MLLYLSFILLFLPIFIGQKKCRCCINIDFMSMEYTDILRCIAIFMVMMQHLAGFILDSRYFTPFWGAGVCIFLIISGYGLTKSSQKKGLKDFWEKKFFRVFFPWLLVWSVTLLTSHKQMSYLNLISGLFLLNSYNWYLQFLFVCYMTFYISHKCFYHLRWYIMLFIFIVSFLFWNNIQAEQSLSFIIGCLLAEKEQIRNKLSGKWKYCLSALCLFIILLCIKQLPAIRDIIEECSIFEHSLNLLLKCSLAFVVILGIQFTNKIMNYKFVKYISQQSYELYLVHLYIVIGICQSINTSLLKILTFYILSILFSFCLYRIDNIVMNLFEKNRIRRSNI